MENCLWSLLANQCGLNTVTTKSASLFLTCHESCSSDNNGQWCPALCVERRLTWGQKPYVSRLAKAMAQLYLIMTYGIQKGLSVRLLLIIFLSWSLLLSCPNCRTISFEGVISGMGNILQREATASDIRFCTFAVCVFQVSGWPQLTSSFGIICCHKWSGDRVKICLGVYLPEAVT